MKKWSHKPLATVLFFCFFFLFWGGDSYTIFCKMVSDDQYVLGVTGVQLYTEKIHA